MKLLRLLPFLAGLAASALPSSELQEILGDLSDYSELTGPFFSDVAKGIQHVADKFISGGQQAVQKWSHDGKQFLKQNGITYELITHPAFANYQLRVTEPTLCDPYVQQYSGYLDISEDKHLFFWFFESRNAPETDPLTLWLNGGPGCSSVTGMLFELGPCRVSDEGKNVTYNEHSWNANSNMIFLDQPVNVGYSYASDGTTVNTTPVAAEDVYAFLELFLSNYRKYAAAPFHVAAESYGGRYAPLIASVIYNKNKALALAPVPRVVHINLASVILANGQTDPLIQLPSIPDYACDGPYAVFDPAGPECAALKAKAPNCARLIQSCYRFQNRLACVPAQLYCNTQMYGSFQQLGLNPYDVRKTCDREKDGDLCYKEMGWVETWMNDPIVKKSLGVDASPKPFASCNMELNSAFLMQGDGVHNSADLLPELINDGVRLLVYAGITDFMCNFIGNERWMDALEHNFHDEFTTTLATPWVTKGKGAIAGTVRAAGGDGFTAGNVTFVTVHEAGHMVPADQPEAAVDLFDRWIQNVPLSFVESD